MAEVRCDCLLVQPIAQSAVRLLEEAGLRVQLARDTDMETLRPWLSQVRAVITRNHGLSADEIAAAPHLQVVGVHGTGTDRVHKVSLAERGIPLVNTAGANAQSVAELTITLMLACSRSLVLADRATRQVDFAFRQTHRTFELSGRRLGLVGYGHIARLVARFALAIGMEVATFSRFTSADDLAKNGVKPMQDIDGLCAWSDIVSLHGVPAGQPVIGARQLELLGPGGILINTARGALIDEEALAAALKSAVIAGAGLDVMATEPPVSDDPLLRCPNLILTPHIGGSTEEALERTGKEVATKVLAELVKLQRT
ncbi:D-3-phosphoglycerate dehydrogenase [Faunimonas pinastri]|uniref:D-3-phosphoglycerate dehydrogenase n=1 Tax=Faunimonas pinastri TaxID=1855383 RepID=A0A1H9E1V5_9HYPH|nr:NAD(P)-dependent oxidoreductase [Faunimonas pinastri]SEQ19719.1 D-3-phosphoglycerate dehydrogenase [Faunimonas pinastri]